MTVESQQDLDGLLRAGRVVALVLQEMQAAVRAGMTTAELDRVGEAALRRHGARPAPRLTYDFPGAACISVNDEAAHGIPGRRVVRAGDLVKIDVSAELDGFFADAAVTVAVPSTPPERQRLVDCALEATQAAVAAATAGAPLNAVGRAAEAVASRCGFQVIADLPGHGVGRALHEAPTVPTVYQRRAKQPLRDGLVITIEPHVAAGLGRIFPGPDGWTLRTLDGGYVAQFEHTIVVTGRQPIVATAFTL